MKKGFLVVLLLSLVVAIPACKQRDCNDKCRLFSCKKRCDDNGEMREKKDKKCCFNPCKIFKCRKKCDDVVREPREKKEKKCCFNPCKIFRCKKKCDEVREPKPRCEKKKKCCFNPCKMLKCKKKCKDDADMMDEEAVMPRAARPMPAAADMR